MSKFFKNLLLFTIFAVITYPFLLFIAYYSPISKILKPKNINYRIGSYGHMYSRLNEVRQLNGNIDILFLGSSHSYRGFDPRNFKDKKTFNLGSSAQTPIQTKILLERYLNKVQPKMVIYEVYPGTFEMDGVESSLDLIANDKNDFRSIKMALMLNNSKIYNTLIYAGFVDIFNLNKNFVEQIRKVNDTYISGGFVESDIQYNKTTKNTKSEWAFRKNQVKAFDENIKLLKSKNIKTILVFAPITESIYNSYTNNNFVDSSFKTYDLEYYNFNKILQLNDSIDFYDVHHLNQNGVKIFNNKLKEILKL